MKKSITLTLVNDSEGLTLKAFYSAAQQLEIEFTVVSQMTKALVDISVKYNNETELFSLGMMCQLRKLQLS
jgi:hypothetical protein